MWANLLPKKTGSGVRKPYTVQYDIGDGQRERSFVTSQAAKEFHAEVLYKGREGTFIDPKLGSIKFGPYARGLVRGMAASDGTRKVYLGILANWVEPWTGERTLQAIANDREGFTALVNRQMTDVAGRLLSYNRRATARTIVLAVLAEAVAAGLNSHRLDGIKLVDSASEITERDDFVFPSHAEITQLASRLGIVVWLMRGCGLRINEALAVARKDFRDGGRTLRVSGQASLDGMRKVALKHRKDGEYRDVPVPGYLRAMVAELPDGPLCPSGNGTPYATSSATYKAFVAEAGRIGIPAGFRPHSLRHGFASALLSQGVPITTVATYLGHRSIEITFKTYAHLLPSAAGDAADALDREYKQWADDDQAGPHDPRQPSG